MARVLVGVLVALVAGCAARRGAVVVDLTADFLRGPCAATDRAGFARAWLEHERRAWRDYGALYYPDGGAGREDAAAARAERREEVCKQVRAFSVAAPPLVAALLPVVARYAGAPPAGRVVLAVPLAGSDGNTFVVDGQVVVALNAAAETYARLNGAVVTITHELLHSAQKARWGRELAALPPVAASLYSEGHAVYAMTLAYPETGVRATGLTPEKLAAIDLRAAAADVLANLDAAERPARFFSGGEHKLGYVVGLELFRRLARRDGERAALDVSPTRFIAESRRLLADMAAAPGGA